LSLFSGEGGREGGRREGGGERGEGGAAAETKFPASQPAGQAPSQPATQEFNDYEIPTPPPGGPAKHRASQ